MNVTVVLPSLDPDEKLNATVEGLLAAGFTDLVLVDDGSAADRREPFQRATERPEVTLLTHEVNRGKGRAMKTAFAYILEHRPDSAGVVTVDGDGQHRPEDVLACAGRMEAEDAVILGCRDFSAPGVPWKSRAGNRLTSLVFRALCGLRISDTQTGLRAIPRKYLPLMLRVEGERYEYETGMLFALKREGVPFAEQRIGTVYLDGNASSHFDPVRDSLKVYRIIAKELERKPENGAKRPFPLFLASSGTAALIDYGLFTLLDFLMGAGTARGTRLFTATFAARAVSSLFNFTVNRAVVFRSDAPVGRSLRRYYALCAVQAASSFALVFLLSALFRAGPGLESGLKILVDCLLFLLSYQIQRRFVFRWGSTGKGT